MRTPGLWKADHLGKVRCAAEGGKGLVAEAHDGTFSINWPKGQDMDVCRANAKFIAQAPAMFTFIEKVRDYARESGDDALYADADKILTAAATE